MAFTIGIYLFPNIELLDFAGPYEVFSVAATEHKGEQIHVCSISEDGGAAVAVNGLKMVPDYSFADCPLLDILVVPGGNGTRDEMQKEAVLNWLRDRAQQAKLIISVCSGSRLLGKLGLLDGIAATTHHEVLQDMRQIAPAADLNAEARFVHCGRILTSAGISAGIDASLYAVRQFFGEQTAKRTIVYMEYGDWRSADSPDSLKTAVFGEGCLFSDRP